MTMKRAFRIDKKKPIRICANCGHDHVVPVGDLNSWECERYELLDECCFCNCENYERVTK